MRSASVVPDLSSASVRVSEIVSTAILSGTNCLVSSMDIELYLVSRTRCSVLHAAPQSRDPSQMPWLRYGPRISSATFHVAQHPGHGRHHYAPEPNVLQACTVPC